MAQSRIRLGETVDAVLLSRSRALSPLGRYIAACRAGRHDLAERFRRSAQEQHWSCPLYRQACRRLISRKAYPVLEVVAGLNLPGRSAEGIPQFSLN
jgi:hypothetical protein